jgi:hypothetical protein
MVADNMYLAKKQMQTINRTTKNWLKVEIKEIVHEEFLPYEFIIINHRNQQLYEWNINDMLQYKILNELYEIFMVSNVYKSNNKTDHQISNV